MCDIINRKFVMYLLLLGMEIIDMVFNIYLWSWLVYHEILILKILYGDDYIYM